MKKNLLVIILSLAIIIPLTSAAGVGSFLDSIDQSTLVLGCLFVIFFALANFSLGKFFKDRKTGQTNKGITSVVSFCLALLMIYGVNKSNWDYSNFLGGLGLPEEVLMTILAVLLAAGLVFMLIKLKTRALLFTGLFLIFLAYFAEALNVEFDKGKLLVTGAILILLWLIILIWLKFRKKKGNVGEGGSGEGGSSSSSSSSSSSAGGQTSERDRNTIINDERQINVNIQGIEQIVQAIINSRTGGNEDQAVRQLEERLSRIEAELREARRAYEEALNQARRDPQNSEIKNNINISLNLVQKMQKEKEQAEQRVTEVIKYVKERKTSLLTLKQKYMYWIFTKNTYSIKSNRKGISIEEKKSLINQMKSMRQAMEIIIKKAEQMGCSKERFLSKEIGGIQGKKPEEYDWITFKED